MNKSIVFNLPEVGWKLGFITDEHYAYILVSTNGDNEFNVGTCFSSSMAKMLRPIVELGTKFCGTLRDGKTVVGEVGIGKTEDGKNYYATISIGDQYEAIRLKKKDIQAISNLFELLGCSDDD